MLSMSFRRGLSVLSPRTRSFHNQIKICNAFVFNTTTSDNHNGVMSCCPGGNKIRSIHSSLSVAMPVKCVEVCCLLVEWTI